MYPWAGFGLFLFRKSETVLWGSDAGWNFTPAFVRQQPLGAGTPVTTQTGLALDRHFDINLLPDRYDELAMFLNTVALFTDWTRPLPDSRMAFLAGLDSHVPVIRVNPQNGYTERLIPTTVTLINA